MEPGLEDVRRALRLEREIDEPQSIIPGLIRFALVNLLANRREEAEAAFDEALGILPRVRHRGFWMLPEVAVDLERQSVVREFVARAPASAGQTAALAMLDGEFGRAADVYDAAGFAVFAADARQRAARALITAGRRAEGEAELAKALVFYRSVGASVLIRRAEELLAATA